MISFALKPSPSRWSERAARILAPLFLGPVRNQISCPKIEPSGPHKISSKKGTALSFPILGGKKALIQVTNSGITY